MLNFIYFLTINHKQESIILCSIVLINKRQLTIHSNYNTIFKFDQHQVIRFIIHIFMRISNVELIMLIDEFCACYLSFGLFLEAFDQCLFEILEVLVILIFLGVVLFVGGGGIIDLGWAWSYLLEPDAGET